MNQRFQELAQEAGLYVDVNGQPWPRNMNGEDIEGAYQKFAELIVREVFAKIEDERFEVYQPVKESVMKHFGVEE